LGREKRAPSRTPIQRRGGESCAPGAKCKHGLPKRITRVAKRSAIEKKKKQRKKPCSGRLKRPLRAKIGKRTYVRSTICWEGGGIGGRNVQEKKTNDSGGERRGTGRKEISS